MALVLMTRTERALQLIERVKEIGGAFFLVDHEGDRRWTVGYPPEDLRRFRALPGWKVFEDEVGGHIQEISDILWRQKDEEEAAAMPAHKLRSNELTDRSAEALEAFELMLADKPRVTVREVWQELGQGIRLSAFEERVRVLVKSSWLIQHKTGPNELDFYSLPPDFAEKKRLLVVLESKSRPPRQEELPLPPVSTPPPPLPRPQPRLEEPDMLNGLPYTLDSELRGRLGIIIQAFEALQEHLGPTLALLLDLDRNFDRYARVRDKLTDLEKELSGVGL